jgi:hypothetical protein
MCTYSYSYSHIHTHCHKHTHTHTHTPIALMQDPPEKSHLRGSRRSSIATDMHIHIDTHTHTCIAPIQDPPEKSHFRGSRRSSVASTRGEASRSTSSASPTRKQSSPPSHNQSRTQSSVSQLSFDRTQTNDNTVQNSFSRQATSPGNMPGIAEENTGKIAAYAPSPRSPGGASTSSHHDTHTDSDQLKAVPPFLEAGHRSVSYADKHLPSATHNYPIERVRSGDVSVTSERKSAMKNSRYVCMYVCVHT